MSPQLIGASTEGVLKAHISSNSAVMSHGPQNMQVSMAMVDEHLNDWSQEPLILAEPCQQGKLWAQFHRDPWTEILQSLEAFVFEIGLLVALFTFLSILKKVLTITITLEQTKRLHHKLEVKEHQMHELNVSEARKHFRARYAFVGT
ncbi:hypothetical protein OPV22_016921 [Ensete ventricosum]|uniref:Uncharacterized protein n=1 Tax=Ensete ventricosum TaxID=4639 RepID=A0AAV8PEF0_ENSVE|nr:hypothetical protein OPV22_016921 [Ensete ventricosum]